MKSSKIENIFSYNPPTEDSKTLSPFTYYQPFQSSFDPDFSVPPPKTTVRANPQGKRRTGERPTGDLQVPGGGLLSPEGGGFIPRPSPNLKATLPVASTSSWVDPEGRGICGSPWSCPVAPRPSFSGESKRSVSGGSGSGMPRMWLRGVEEGGGQLPPKGGEGCSVFGGLDGNSSLAGGSLSFCQSAGQVGSFEGGLSQSAYYPLVLNPLGKNASQNVYKTGHSRPMMCNFCKNNKEVPDIYLNHYLYDPETKVLSCPVLRKHVCEICGGTGDQAHTLQYCPVNRERGLQSKVPVLLKTRTITNSTGKIRRN